MKGEGVAIGIVVAGGKGLRFGGTIPKQFLEVAGKPLVAHTLSSFARCRVIMRTILVLPREGFAEAVSIMEPYVEKRHGPGAVALVPGGASRQASVLAGLDTLSAASDDCLVAVHDGARPLVTPGLIERVVGAAARHGGAIAAVPVVETLKRVSKEGLVAETVERESYVRAQTPQCFPLTVLRRAFARAEADGFVGTDEAALVERLGVPIAIVPGEETNLKVTRLDDVTRVGHHLSEREGEGEA